MLAGLVGVGVGSDKAGVLVGDRDSLSLLISSYCL